MKNRAAVEAVLFAGFTCIRADITTSCPLEASLQSMDPKEVDSLNRALESAYSSFNQNPTYSSANAVFSTAKESFPAAVSASLYCSGFGGINTRSPPAWLTPIPTAVVSIVLKEEAVYESIISSFIENVDSESAASSLTSSSPSRSPTSATSDGMDTIISSSHRGTATSASATLATATQYSPSSSAGAPESSGSLAGSVLAAAGFIFAGLL